MNVRYNLLKKKNTSYILLCISYDGKRLQTSINEKIEIDQILVEFHPHLFKNGRKKTKSYIIKLESFGYKCFARSNSFLEYSFIR